MKLDQTGEEPVKKMEPCGAIDTNGRKSTEKRAHDKVMHFRKVKEETSEERDNGSVD